MFSSWCPCCLETEFLPCSSVMASLLGVLVSFQTRCSTFEFLVHLFIRPTCSQCLLTCPLPGSCFRFQTLAPPSPPPPFSSCRLLLLQIPYNQALSTLFINWLFFLLLSSDQCGISSQAFHSLSCQTAQFYGEIIFPLSDGIIWHESVTPPRN